MIWVGSVIDNIITYIVEVCIILVIVYFLLQEVKKIIEEQDWSRLIICIIIACIFDVVILTMSSI